MKTLMILSIFTILTSCAFNSNDTQIFSLPDEFIYEPKAPIIKLTFALTNSFNSKYEAEKEFYEKNQGVFLNVGGCEQLYQFTKSLKQYHKEKLVLVHAGNFTNKASDNYLSLTNCIAKIDYDVIAPSAFEFINKEKYKNKVVKENFIINNFIDLKTGKTISSSPFTPSILLEKEGVKIGIISIFDSNLTQGQIGEKYINGILIEDSVATILKENTYLREKGANIIVLIIQNLSECYGNVYTLKNINNNQLKCRFSDPLKNIVKRLPRETVDIILSGSKAMANGFISEIPVLQNTGDSKYISMAEIYFNKKTKKLLKGRSRVLPPLKICQKYFKNTQDCYMKSTKDFKFSTTRDDLIGENPNFITPKILGITIESNKY